jgi:hypothetical protein
MDMVARTSSVGVSCLGARLLVRKAEPRTFDAVSDALKNALAQVAPSECANYLRHAGYAYT